MSVNLIIKKHHSFKLADAVLCLLVGEHELDVSPQTIAAQRQLHADFYEKYGVTVSADAWDNGREQGYCLTLHGNGAFPGVVICFATHRNCPDNVTVWHGHRPWYAGADDFTNDTFNTVNGAAEFILDLIESHLKETPSETGT